MFVTIEKNISIILKIKKKKNNDFLTLNAIVNKTMHGNSLSIWLKKKLIYYKIFYASIICNDI